MQPSLTVLGHLRTRLGSEEAPPVCHGGVFIQLRIPALTLLRSCSASQTCFLSSAGNGYKKPALNNWKIPPKVFRARQKVQIKSWDKRNFRQSKFMLFPTCTGQTQNFPTQTASFLFSCARQPWETL